ncbi:hypothetical protein GCM10007973_32190 [Polymorphobacter multimanifer]|uniref:Putative membrane protein n=1 Tax=Polymorphobacter multimanifer TaxID=1070431 RepID=A0A841L5J1_9SPHN|nr:DUF2243 domain-containing protein [Polymorphobacter multimanifer]MBB6227526.1 putative membrane protein [Polymorphobacter multimanifer]GGI93453.1 hypothetical protein GCM10007973_32190 [Polymorphobacter multimanifer]
MQKPSPTQPSSTRASIIVGIGLGGFFDGILLHQILQWHHLLSLVPGVDSLRLQALWDGWFHALMYIITAVGLIGLWRSRAALPPARHLGGGLLIGVGAWHVLDSIASHWVLGIHRIRVDSPNPLVWDLVWFVVFGLVPLAIGWLLMRGRPMPGPGRRNATTAVVLLAAFATGAAAWSLRPAEDQRFTTIVFRPDVTPGQVIDVLAATDARLVWTDPAMGVVVVAMAPDRRWSLYPRGALLVSGSGVPTGCFGWTRA